MLSLRPYWSEVRFRAMGSTAHLIVGDAHEQLLDWAVAEIERLEQCWSRFRPDSELCALNARPGEWVRVSTDLLGALTRARRLWQQTAGSFDPTVLGALEALGYDRTFDAVADRCEGSVPGPVPAPGFGRVELDEDASAARLEPGVRIDLGGIGKGLAADLVADGLVLRGASSALVGLGGDIRAAGSPPEGGWRVPVQDPFDAMVCWTESILHSEAIVTSTSLMRRWTRGARTVHHIVDPIDGAPTSTGIVAVVAQGAEAWWAEGLAKAAMVVGEEGAPSLLDGTNVQATLFRADRSAVTIDGSGVLCSPS